MNKNNTSGRFLYRGEEDIRSFLYKGEEDTFFRLNILSSIYKCILKISSNITFSASLNQYYNICVECIMYKNLSVISANSWKIFLLMLITDKYCLQKVNKKES